MSDESNPSRNQALDIRPVPDPTVLTQDALDKLEFTLRNLIIVEILHRAELTSATFASIEIQFKDLKERTAEQKKDCVAASTPVLCADLVWRPAGDLVVGDELITVDDEAVSAAGARTPRRFRRGVVTANRLEEDELVRVKSPVGDLVCNRHHPILVKRPSGNRLRYWRWVQAKDLREGDQLAHVVDVWATDRSWEAGWLAGMFDGEGCLNIHAGGTRPRLSLVQRVSPTADLIEHELVARLDRFQMQDKPVPEHCQPQTAFVINRRAEIMKMLGRVRPPRLMVKSHLVWEGQSIGGRERAVPMTGVEAVGTGTIAMLSVSTGTYIAGGFASHNTKDALDAALAAQKEAVKEQTLSSEKSITKSETATAERIKTVETLLGSNTKGIDDKIDDLKERLVAMENRGFGLKEGSEVGHVARTDGRQMMTIVTAGVAALVGIIALVISIFLAIKP